MNWTTVLVVDDAEQVRQLVALILRAQGHEVHTAGDATEALALANQLQCRLNLLLTDMVMPGTDGHDLILAIRRLCQFMETILMSGALMPDDTRFKNYQILNKPCTTDQLATAVKEIVSRQIH